MNSPNERGLAVASATVACGSPAIGRLSHGHLAPGSSIVLVVVLTAALWRDCHSVGAAEPESKTLAAGDVDPETSRIYVRVGKRRLGHEHGVEGRVKSGRLVLDASESAGEIVFDMSSFKADTEAARKYVGLEGTTDADEQADVTKTMTGKGVLDIANHPTATFTIASSKRMADDTRDGHPQYELIGEFDLHGKKQPLSVTAVAGDVQDGRLPLTGMFAIKQTDYGIKPYSALGGIVAVTDELKIFGDLRIAK